MPESRKRLVPLLLMLAPLWAGSGLAAASSETAHAVDPALTAPIRQTLDALMRVPGGTPAMAAVLVQGDAGWIDVRGRVRADRDGLADADTRFYIASQTKSFIGLLAAVLDARGEFPLSRTLAEVWPDLRLPPPADPRRISMADLLSHQEGLTTNTLNILAAHVRDVRASEYPSLLATEVTPRDAGFRYANIGDLVYGAALEAATGRNWRDWLDAAVLHPLGLDGVSARTSAIPSPRLAWNHQWDGAHWRALRPKPDALMHAAGGLAATPKAMAHWMQVNLDIGDASGALPAAAWQRSQQPIARSKLADGEIDCNGYSLGWYNCSYRGQQALMHPGSYDGAVSVTVLVPSAKAGMRAKPSACARRSRRIRRRWRRRHRNVAPPSSTIAPIRNGAAGHGSPMPRRCAHAAAHSPTGCTARCGSKQKGAACSPASANCGCGSNRRSPGCSPHRPLRWKRRNRCVAMPLRA